MKKETIFTLLFSLFCVIILIGTLYWLDYYKYYEIEKFNSIMILNLPFLFISFGVVFSKIETGPSSRWYGSNDLLTKLVSLFLLCYVPISTLGSIGIGLYVCLLIIVVIQYL